MSVSLTPSKRQQQQQDGTLGESELKPKLQKCSSENEPSRVNFRLLFPGSKLGGLMGKDEAFASEIESQTGGSKLSVDELVPGCDERVLLVSFEGKDESSDGKDEKEKKEPSEGVRDKEHSSKDYSNSRKGHLSVQMGLLLVFDRMAEEVKGKDETKKKKKRFPPLVMRILVPSNKIGRILGRGGSLIKKMASLSGAQIRIIPRDKIPSCVSDLDELVQITGSIPSVRKALQSVSSQVLGITSLEQDSLQAPHPTPTSSSSLGQANPRPQRFPQPKISFGRPHNIDHHSVVPRLGEGGIPGRMRQPLEILHFRLLCREDRIGGVVGVKWQFIKAVEQDTGCEIKVFQVVPGSEDYVVLVSGPVHPDDRISGVQDAVLRIQGRIARVGLESNELFVTARLLVSSVQVACLLGKGGSVMAEMRKFSLARIHVLPKDHIPKYLSEDEEVVQIKGDFEAVQEALMQITTRLQHFFFGDAFPSFNFPRNPSFLDRPHHPPFSGRRELAPPRMYPNPFHKFDPFDMPPPHGGFHPRDDHHGSLMHDIDRFGGPIDISERKRWGTQGFRGGDGESLPELSGGPHKTSTGLLESDHIEALTSTAVEVVVPTSVVPEIRGEDDECLKQIREISDAKITITETKLGEEETVIVLFGTPEQTHAAQSLIQAFVISATESIVNEES